ncbi:hypothetical protein EBZ80_23385 [bacterium]|nr:hypothetical protein [bacterium]
MITKYTELSLRTAFIRTPVKLLDEIGEAIIQEDSADDAEALLNLVVKHNYIRQIFNIIGNIANTSDELRSAALWTAGLMLASDYDVIRYQAVTLTFKQFPAICNMLFDDAGCWKHPSYGALHGQRSAAFLVHNLMRNRNIMRTSFGAAENTRLKEILRNRLTENASTIKKYFPCFESFKNLPPNAMSDYFWAVSLLLGYTDNLSVSTFLPLVHDLEDWMDVDAKAVAACIGALSEKNGAITAENYADVMTWFKWLFENRAPLREVHWTLSNYVCEPGVADLFLRSLGNEEDPFHQMIHDYVINASEAQAENSLWVLANCVANVQDEDLKRAIVDPEDNRYYDLWDTLEGDATEYKVARDGFAYLEQWYTEFYPEVEEYTDTDTDTDTDTEVEIVEEGTPATNSCEHLGEAEAATPSALQLLTGKLPEPSETVRRLVGQLKSTGVYDWVPVADNTAFSVADMRWMEGSGYVVSQGHFGIAPWLRWGC